MDKIEKIVDNLLNKKINPLVWMINFLGIIVVRLLLDKFIARSGTPLFDLIMDIHNILIFLLIFLFIWLVLSLILRKKPFELAYLMSFISIAILFPPIFDLFKAKGAVFWSFYLISAPQDLFQQFLTVFGHLPSGINYFGSKIVFIPGIILLSGLVFLKTRHIFKTILSAVGIYLALFLPLALPSILAYFGLYFEKGKNILEIQPFEIIQFFSNFKVLGLEIQNINYALAYNLNFVFFLLIIAILGIMFFWSDKQKFQSFVKNIRFPQLGYHLGLLLLGLFLGYLAFPDNFSFGFFSFLALLTLLVSIWLSWEASVVVNDLNDTEIDKISNRERPLPSGIFEKKEFGELGIIIFVLAIMGGFMVDYKFGIILIAYQVLSWFYSAKPFRFKRFLGAASILASSALLLIFFLGFILVSGQDNLVGLSPRIILFLLLANILCLPIKDFKDIEGDKKDGVLTLPVIFGEEKSRLMTAIGFFISYISSVFFLNEFRLFWWALIFGAVSFLIITSKKIKPEKLLFWNLLTAFLYALVLIKIVFLYN